jgi:hypothetical protein
MASEGVIAVSAGSIWPARAAASSSASGSAARNGAANMPRRVDQMAWSATQTEAEVRFRVLPESISRYRVTRGFLDALPSK